MGPERQQLSTPAGLGHGELDIAPGALKRIALVCAWAFGAVAVALLPVRICLFARIFHVPCPGCGMTRATLALLRGDFARAFHLHPLSLVIVPLLSVALGEAIVRYVRTGMWSDGPLPRWTEIAAAVIVIALIFVWAARTFGYLGGPVPV